MIFGSFLDAIACLLPVINHDLLNCGMAGFMPSHQLGSQWQSWHNVLQQNSRSRFFGLGEVGEFSPCVYVENRQR